MEENDDDVSFSFSSHPLLSCLITLYTLLLIYFPNLSLRIIFSPVLLISGAILVSLLHLGKSNEGKTRSVYLDETLESNVLASHSPPEANPDTKPDFAEFRSPLEVIHEADEDDDENPPATVFREIERHPSLSLCYPESDSDSSSEFSFPEMGKWMSSEKMGFTWEDEEDDGNGGEEGLIEIKLGGDHRRSYDEMSKRDQTEFDFHAEEEESLIEINLFP